MARCLFIGLISFITIFCTNRGSNIEGVWEYVPQYDHENHIVYSFTNDKYQVVVNGEKLETPLPYKIEGDTIILDRGEHWVLIVGKQNRYIKESYFISKGREGTTLMLGDLLFKKVNNINNIENR